MLDDVRATNDYFHQLHASAEPYPFRIVRNPRSWASANLYCSYFDMTLVVVPDENKQRQLVEYLLLEETTAQGYVVPFHSSYAVWIDFSEINIFVIMIV